MSVGVNPGSPPRMRVKLPVFSTCRADSRITPAHAGKTVGVDELDSDFKDHPRAYG